MQPPSATDLAPQAQYCAEGALNPARLACMRISQLTDVWCCICVVTWQQPQHVCATAKRCKALGGRTVAIFCACFHITAITSAADVQLVCFAVVHWCRGLRYSGQQHVLSFCNNTPASRHSCAVPQWPAVSTCSDGAPTELLADEDCHLNHMTRCNRFPSLNAAFISLRYQFSTLPNPYYPNYEC